MPAGDRRRVFRWTALALLGLGLLQPTNPFVINKQNNSLSLQKDDLAIILMGDTQYYFVCELSNPPCREYSRRCREELARMKMSKTKEKYDEKRCKIMESRYSNRVQRKALDSLIASQRYPPAGLIINGDLTDYGHPEEFEEFLIGWADNFPIPIYPGLGNHDYDNNVNDTFWNHAADRMVKWFIDYTKNRSIDVQSKKLDNLYTGSLAYSKRLCSVTGKNCAQVIQLNNAIDYEVYFTSFLTTNFNISSPYEFLKKQLHVLKDMNIPILINVHQNEDAREEKMKQLLGDWIYQTRSMGITRRIGVFFAHMHGSHEAKVYCFHGVPVPFVYVGSVPNNRFSVLKISADGDSLIGFAARDNKSIVLGELDKLWDGQCNKSYLHLFQDKSYYGYRRIGPSLDQV